MITFSTKIRECDFHKIILDNMNISDDYIDELHHSIMNERGDEPIKFMPFFIMVQAYFDHEFIRELTGNLDADL